MAYGILSTSASSPSRARERRIVSETGEHDPARPAPPAKNGWDSQVVPREARPLEAGQAPPGRASRMSWRHRWFPNGEWVLLLVLAGEILFFSAIAPNFFTLGNFFEVTRFSVELGLLAVALTPVIVAGGIDLSVGSMMGLAAVCFGAAFHEWHLAVPLATAYAVLVGCAGGALNAV